MSDRREYFKAYNKLRREKMRRYYATYRVKHREKLLAYAKIYYEKWRIENAEKIKGYQLSYRNKIRLGAQQRLGGICAKCGFSDWRALQIDHIKGGGREEERRLGSNLAIHKRVLKMAHPEKEYQVLCANCNTIKRYTNNECAKKCRSTS